MPTTETPTNTPASTQSIPGKRKRKFRSEAEWRSLIQCFEQSALTQVAFCKEHGITTSGLNLWRKRLADTASGSPEPPSGFVPLGELAEHSTATQAEPERERRWQVELELAPGRTLKITLI